MKTLKTIIVFCLLFQSQLILAQSVSQEIDMETVKIKLKVGEDKVFKVAKSFSTKVEMTNKDCANYMMWPNLRQFKIIGKSPCRTNIRLRTNEGVYIILYEVTVE